VAAIVKVSILVSLASAWLGVCIAGIVHAWEFLRYLRKQISGARHPASLQLQYESRSAASAAPAPSYCGLSLR
jgi:hypothetical protein